MFHCEFARARHISIVDVSHRQRENIRDVCEDSRLTTPLSLLHAHTHTLSLTYIVELRLNSPCATRRGTILRRIGVPGGLLSVHTGIHVESTEYSSQRIPLPLRGE